MLVFVFVCSFGPVVFFVVIDHLPGGWEPLEFGAS